MNLKNHLLAAAVLAGFALSSPIHAQSGPAHERFGVEKPFDPITHVEIRNLQGESLGHIRELGLDLVNGRIVEVLVVTGDIYGLGGKVVAVPPQALIPDQLNKIYLLDVSRAAFKAAPAVHVWQWRAPGQSTRIAAAYRLFGQEPYFLAEGETSADPTKQALGFVERSTRIITLPVGNFQKEYLGKVWTMTFDVTKGRILNVVLLAPGSFKTKSVIPATALCFNAARDGLLLGCSKMEDADEPRYLYTEAAFGHEGHFREESYQGPRTSVALVQGVSADDMERTARIYQDIRIQGLDGLGVEVGTVNGRVTLRGKADSADEQHRLGAIAAAVSRREVVDNQVLVETPAVYRVVADAAALSH